MAEAGGVPWPGYTPPATQRVYMQSGYDRACAPPARMLTPPRLWILVHMRHRTSQNGSFWLRTGFPGRLTLRGPTEMLPVVRNLDVG